MLANNLHLLRKELEYIGLVPLQPVIEKTKFFMNNSKAPCNIIEYFWRLVPRTTIIYIFLNIYIKKNYSHFQLSLFKPFDPVTIIN